MMKAYLWLTLKDIASHIASGWNMLVLALMMSTLGIFVWVAPGYNVLDGGIASLDIFFGLAPWVLIFFVPAICMTSLSEEVDSGTLDLLQSRPFTSLGIIISKFLARMLILTVVMSLSGIYLWSMSSLSAVPGNLDWGSLWGSSLGLFLLICVLCGLSIMTSALTTKPLSAFALGLLVCFWLYYGFFLTSQLPGLYGGWDYFMRYLGIDFHYQSMSRGLIYFQDVFYLLSLTALALAFAGLLLEKSKSL